MKVPEENFADRFCRAVEAKKNFECAGLDPQVRFMPPHLIREAVRMYGRTFEAMGWLFREFNRQVIDVVHDIVPAVKPNLAFYERYGRHGIDAFEYTVAYAREKGLLVIGDGKRGDGGDTAEAYADCYLGEVPFFGAGEDPAAEVTHIVSQMRVDCLTIHAYIGEACIKPFTNEAVANGTGVFIVDKTSFKPNSAIEQLITAPGCEEQGVAPTKVWQNLARMVDEWGEGTEGACGLRNVGVVMGATYPEEAVIMRQILSNAILLKPGFGRQGGGAADAVVGILPSGFGIVVNNSRGLIYAWQKGDYACEPEKFADAVRKQAISDRDALVAAAREAGKWPF